MTKGPMRRHARPTLLRLYGLPLALAVGRAEILFVTLGVLLVAFLTATSVSSIHTLRTNCDLIVRTQMG